MKRHSHPKTSPRRQRGATLIMALVMIVLLSLIVISAFNLSTSNLKSVGNMQSRDESLAAANSAIEQTVSGNFFNASTAQTVTVDIDKDGTTDYSVTVSPPTCIGYTLAEEGAPSDPDLPSSAGWWFTDWDIKTTVTDSNSGASLVVRAGVRAFMDDTTKVSKCT